MCVSLRASSAIMSSSSVGTTSAAGVRCLRRDPASGVGVRARRWRRASIVKPEEAQAAQGHSARMRGVVLADPAGEDERIEPAERDDERRPGAWPAGRRRRPAQARPARRRRRRPSRTSRMSLVSPDRPSRPLSLLSAVVTSAARHAGRVVRGSRRRPGRCRRTGCPSPAPPAASAPSWCRPIARPALPSALQPLPRCATTRAEVRRAAGRAAPRRAR